MTRVASGQAFIWSAVTCYRFPRSRLVATIENVFAKYSAKAPNTKVAISHRTPKIRAISDRHALAAFQKLPIPGLSLELAVVDYNLAPRKYCIDRPFDCLAFVSAVVDVHV